MDNNLPDLLRDYELVTQFHGRHTIHRFEDPDAPPSSPQRWEYWENEGRIGRGGQGEVFLQKCTSGSRSYTQRAVKKIPLPYDGGRRRYIREIETIIKFSHDRYSRYFAKTLGWYKSSDSLWIAMEYFPTGDLNTYLGERKRPPLSEDDCCQVTSQVLQGLAVMHGAGFAHRDIKPHNVLIQQCPTSVPHGPWWVKLADFGLSKRLGAATSDSTMGMGTEEYKAPELFDYGVLSDINYQAADMWALGVMTFFLLTKRPLFQSRRSIVLYNGPPESLFPSGSVDDCQLSLDVQAFIGALVRPKPEERLGSEAAKRLVWVYPWMPRVPTIPDANSEPSSSPSRSPVDEERGMANVALAEWTDPTSPGQNGETQIFVAAKEGHVEVVKLLLENGAHVATPDNDGCTPVFAAAKEGYVEIVKLLVENGADITTPNDDGLTPICAAASHGLVEAVKLLLENGADVTTANKNGWTPVFAAATTGYVDVVKLLVENGADVTTTDNYGRTPVYAAATKGHVEMVKVLLEEGANITTPTNSGWTPVFAAANEGHVDMVKVLLEKGADITTLGMFGRTLVYSAAEGGHVDVVKLLLENGAHIATPDNDGCTPVFAAAKEGHVEIVKLLVENGADVTTPNDDGLTPICAAASHGLIEVVKLLLEKGADITTPTNSGCTPVCAAAKKGHVDVVKVLHENMADIPT